MHRFVLFLLGIAWAGLISAAAQINVSVGIRGGLNRATATADPAGTGGLNPSWATSKQNIFAGQAGVVVEGRRDKLALQSGVLFTQKGEHLDYSYGISGFVNDTYQFSGMLRTNWLEVPFNLTYTTHGDHGLQIFGGPYVAVATGGRRQGTVLKASPFARFAPLDVNEFIKYGDGTNFKRFDAGVNFGVGYRQGPLQIQLAYGLGLRNLRQSTNDVFYDYGRNEYADAAYNRSLQLTGSYFFALSKRKS